MMLMVITTPKKSAITKIPTQAAGGLRVFGSGGVAVASAMFEKSEEQIPATNIFRTNCIDTRIPYLRV